MADYMGTAGGFIAVNTVKGTIDNCYCYTSYKDKNTTEGGFAGTNVGKIKHSYCEFMGAKEGEHDLDSQKSAKEQGFDLTNIWEWREKKPHLIFQDEKWTEKIPMDGKKIVSIKNEKGLFQFAEMVNSGDKRISQVIIRLEADLNLQGKEWTPVGAERIHAFEGIFDGNGHTISNFKIHKDDVSRKGFFGFNRGQIYNLNVDCNLKGTGYMGPLAAINEGVISCCGATATIHGKEKEFCMGGLVAMNEGQIYKSYAAGKYKGTLMMFPIWPLAFVLATISVLAGVWSIIPTATAGNSSMYQAIETDPNQEKVSSTVSDTEENEQTADGSEEFAHTMSFTLNQSIDVVLSSGLCEVDFINPESDDYNIVVELQISDADAIALMGSTGRPKELQKSLEEQAGYDASVNRVTIATSGAISPGYSVENLQLEAFAMKKLPTTGTVNGYISLIPFDPVTQERSTVQTDLPVELHMIQ